MPRQQLQFHEFFQIIESNEKIVKIQWLHTKIHIYNCNFTNFTGIKFTF